MKKTTLFLSIIAAFMLVFSACEIEDLMNPEITLTGGDMEIVLNDPNGFVEPGFMATDDKDGDITNLVIVSGDVDENKIGSYEITYSVSDKSGNKTTVKRTVDVIVDQDTYAGTWAVVEVITGDNPDPNWQYNATVAKSSTDPLKLLVTNFGGFSNFIANLNFDKFGDFTLPSQQTIGSPDEATIVGTGTTSDNGLTLTITYNVAWLNGTNDVSTGTWTKSK